MMSSASDAVRPALLSVWPSVPLATLPSRWPGCGAVPALAAAEPAPWSTVIGAIGPGGGGSRFSFEPWITIGVSPALSLIAAIDVFLSHTNT